MSVMAWRRLLLCVCAVVPILVMARTDGSEEWEQRDEKRQTRAEMMARVSKEFPEHFGNFNGAHNIHRAHKLASAAQVNNRGLRSRNRSEERRAGVDGPNASELRVVANELKTNLDMHLRRHRSQFSEPRIPHKVRGEAMGNHVAAHGREQLHLGTADKYFDAPKFVAATQQKNVKVKNLRKDGMHAMGLGSTQKKAEGQPRRAMDPSMANALKNAQHAFGQQLSPGHTGFKHAMKQAQHSKKFTPSARGTRGDDRDADAENTIDN